MIASKYVVVLKTNVDVFLHRDTVCFVNIVANQLLPSQKFKAFKNALTLDVGGLEVQHSSVVLMVTSSHATRKHSLSPMVFLQRRFSGGIVKMMMKITTHLNALNNSKEFY